MEGYQLYLYFVDLNVFEEDIKKKMQEEKLRYKDISFYQNYFSFEKKKYCLITFDEEVDVINALNKGTLDINEEEEATFSENFNPKKKDRKSESFPPSDVYQEFDLKSILKGKKYTEKQVIKIKVPKPITINLNRNPKESFLCRTDANDEKLLIYIIIPLTKFIEIETIESGKSKQVISIELQQDPLNSLKNIKYMPATEMMSNHQHILDNLKLYKEILEDLFNEENSAKSSIVLEKIGSIDEYSILQKDYLNQFTKIKKHAQEEIKNIIYHLYGNLLMFKSLKIYIEKLQDEKDFLIQYEEIYKFLIESEIDGAQQKIRQVHSEIMSKKLQIEKIEKNICCLDLDIISQEIKRKITTNSISQEEIIQIFELSLLLDNQLKEITDIFEGILNIFLY